MLRKISFIWLMLISWTINAQAPIIKCPIDTNQIFEVCMTVFQSYNSEGKIQKQTWLDYAIPDFNFPEYFIDKETKEKCTPFPLVFENNQLYIFDSLAYSIDSTGEWMFNSDLSKKILLSQSRILSLKIIINNETDEVFDLSEVDILQKLKLPIQYLEISFIHHVRGKVKLNIKKWNFIQFPEQLYSIYIEIPINENKKQVLKNLNRFENLEKIEIRK